MYISINNNKKKPDTWDYEHSHSIKLQTFLEEIDGLMNALHTIYCVIPNTKISKINSSIKLNCILKRLYSKIIAK